MATGIGLPSWRRRRRRSASSNQARVEECCWHSLIEDEAAKASLFRGAVNYTYLLLLGRLRNPLVSFSKMPLASLDSMNVRVSEIAGISLLAKVLEGLICSRLCLPIPYC